MATATEKIIYSAGNGITNELVENNGKKGFAVYDSQSGSCTFTENFGSILPMQDVPWLPPKMPIDYGDAYQLFKEVRSFIFDNVELPSDDDYDVLAAWVMSAYRFMEFESFSYICAIGPPSSGKTRLIKTLWQLSYRGLFGAGLTASAMFRAIHRDHVSIYLDQAEHLANSKDSADYIALVDNGYQKGGKKFLTNTDTGMYEGFDLYSPKTFASTKTLEGTVESRSIRFNMQARTRKISIKIDKARATALRSKLLLYKFKCAEANEDTEEAEAKLMSLIDDGRLIELFLPLYVVTMSASFPSGASVPSEIILQYIKSMNESRRNAEQVTIQAQIVKVITECEAFLENGKLSYSDILVNFNVGKSPKEQWGIKSLAKVIRDLGFESCRMSDGRMGFHWNEKLLSKHQKRFLINTEVKKQETLEENALPLISLGV